MAKNKKIKPTKERASKYDQKLSVKGSFLDVIKAAAANANKNSNPK